MLQKILFPDFENVLFRLRTRGKTSKMAENNSAFSKKARLCRYLYRTFLEVSGQRVSAVCSDLNVDKREFPVPNAIASCESYLEAPSPNGCWLRCVVDLVDTTHGEGVLAANPNLNSNAFTNPVPNAVS